MTSFPKGDIMRVNILCASIGRCPCYSGEEKRLYPAGYLIAATKNRNKRAFKGAVSRNSAKLGNYKMPVKLRET